MHRNLPAATKHNHLLRDSWVFLKFIVSTRKIVKWFSSVSTKLPSTQRTIAGAADTTHSSVNELLTVAETIQSFFKLLAHHVSYALSCAALNLINSLNFITFRVVPNTCS